MQESIIPVIQEYHNLITRDISGAEEQLDFFVSQQRERKLLFGDRPLTYSLRPAFMTEHANTTIQDVVYLIRQSILKSRQHISTRMRLLTNSD
jgi:hypothetical protein